MIDKLIQGVEAELESLLNQTYADPKSVRYLSASLQRLENIKALRIEREKKDKEEQEHKANKIGFGGVGEEEENIPKGKLSLADYAKVVDALGDYRVNKWLNNS